MTAALRAKQLVGGAFRSQLQDPLARNGYALVLNTVCTSGLGVLYWLLAARLFSPAEVGQDAAALTALILVASVGGMNLAGSLSFLLPRLGGSARGFVLQCYLASSALVALLAVGLLAAVLLGGLPLGFLTASGAAAAFFVVAACAWSIFTLQDGVLVGLRAAPWVLAENTTYSIAKLMTLGLLGALGLAHGIYLSWILPALVLIPLVSLLIFDRLLPQVALRADSLDPLLSVRRFVGLNHASALFYHGYVNAMPLLVLAVLDRRATGLFYVAWTWSCAIDLVSHSMGASLTVEGSASPQRLTQLVRSTASRLAVLLGAGATVVVVGAPWLLGAYGPEYADEATGLLQLLVIGAIPRALVILAQSVARARGDGSLVLWTEASTCVLVTGIACLLLAPLGIVGVGIAWLVGNAAVAALVLPALLVHLRRSTS